MELRKGKLSLAAAIMVGVIYIIYALVIWLWPAYLMKYCGLVHLLNLESFTAYVSFSLTWAIVGFVYHFIATFIIVYIFAWLYNLLAKKPV